MKKRIKVFSLLLAALLMGQLSAQTIEMSDLKPGKNLVSFKSEGSKIAALLFLPDDYESDHKHAAIVVVCPASGVKEQTAGIYAEKLAKQDFITLAFDHRTFGESEGEPRCMENAPMKVEDIKNAVSFIASVPGVDRSKIGELGICSGAGYGIQAACFDARIKTVATVSGFIDFIDYGLSGSTQYLRRLSGDKINQFQKQIQIASIARQKYYETGEVVMIEGIPPKGSRIGEFWDRAADYYHNPERGGAIKTYNPERAAMSLDTRYFFNASEHMELMRGKPFLAITGTDAYTAFFSEVAVERAKGDKELFKVKGAHHFDLYDNDKYVNQAIEKLSSFYNRTLK
jgi:fermentation-respiration switch protein FrsA (DUF1100 family)